MNIKISNKNCSELVRNMIPFEASNFSGEHCGNFYIVFSYNWYPLYAYDYELKQWNCLSKKYSKTTTNHARHTNPGNDIKMIVWTDFEAFKERISKGLSHKADKAA